MKRIVGKKIWYVVVEETARFLGMSKWTTPRKRPTIIFVDDTLLKCDARTGWAVGLAYHVSNKVMVARHCKAIMVRTACHELAHNAQFKLTGNTTFKGQHVAQEWKDEKTEILAETVADAVLARMGVETAMKEVFPWEFNNEG